MNKKQKSEFITKAANLKPGEVFSIASTIPMNIIQSALSQIPPNTLIKFESGISKAHILSLTAALPNGACLYLNLDDPQMSEETVTLIAATLPLNTIFHLPATTPIALVQAAAIGLKSGRLLDCARGMPINSIKAINNLRYDITGLHGEKTTRVNTRILQVGTIFLFDPQTDDDACEVASLIQGGRIVHIPFNASSSMISAVANNINQWASLYLKPVTPIDKMIAAAKALKLGAMIYLDAATPEEKVQAIAAAMQEARLLYLDPDMPKIVQRAAAKQLAQRAYLCVNLGTMSKPDLHTLHPDFFLKYTESSSSLSLKEAISKGLYSEFLEELEQAKKANSNLGFFDTTGKRKGIEEDANEHPAKKNNIH